MQKKYVVIGASAAGLACAERLRRLDATAQIICIAAQKELPYNTCFISDLLAEQKCYEEVMTKSLVFFEEQNIALRLGTRVVKIEPLKKQIILDDVSSVSYDALFLGLGRRAFVPPVFQQHLSQGIFPFHTLQNILDLDLFLKNKLNVSVAVIGAGVNGLEAADALVKRGCKVTIIEAQSSIMPLYCNEQASVFLKQKIVQSGITVIKNKFVASYKMNEEDQSIKAVLFSDSTELKTDCVVLALGSMANIELAQEAQITCYGNGILVNEKFQTNFPDVFAGGDICVMYDASRQTVIQSSKWSDAVMQGMCAAHAMVEQPILYECPAVTVNSMFFGIKFISCGPLSNPPTSCTLRVVQGSDFYHAYLLDKNSRLCGFLMIGMVDRVGELRRMVTKCEVFSD